MMEKLLTVVIPVWNTAAYLRRCLDSVLLRDAPEDLELIAVNDGSTDGSGQLLREAAARSGGKLKLIEKKNGGHGSAINAGLQAATGRYFRVLDSDDWFDTPGFLRYLEALRGCREDLIVTPYTQEYAENGTEVVCDYPFLIPDREIIASSIDWRDGMHYFTLASSTWRTRLLRECGLRLLENCSYVDMQYNLAPIPYLRSLRCLNIPVYRYFLGRPGQSMDAARMRRQTPMHQLVLVRLIDDYGALRGDLAPWQRQYTELVLCYMLHTHVELLCVRDGGCRRAFREIRSLDRELRQKAPELYELAGRRIPYLRFSRRLGFQNVRFFDARAVGLLTELNRRLAPKRGEA